jgi:hypothetical protein
MHYAVFFLFFLIFYVVFHLLLCVVGSNVYVSLMVLVSYAVMASVCVCVCVCGLPENMQEIPVYTFLPTTSHSNKRNNKEEYLKYA